MAEMTELTGARLFNYLRFRKDPLTFIHQTQYISDMVSVNSSSKNPSYIIHSLQAIKEILTIKEDKFRKGSSAEVLGRTLGNGVLTSEEPDHRQQKRMMLPAFHRKKIAGYAEEAVRQTMQLCSDWKEGEIREISQDMMNITLGIILKTMFGRDLDSDSFAVTKAVSDVIEKTAQTLLSPFPLPESLPTKRNRLYKKGVKTLEELADDLIRGADKEGDHLLAMLHHASYEDGTSVSEKEIRDQILTILIAGHETTSNALTWVWHLLAENPAAAGLFYEEIDHVLAGRPPVFDDMPSLVYTQQVINESLRLYPAAWIILREATDEVELAGQLFQKGSLFMISPYALHRDEAVFQHPDQFMPARFSKEMKGLIPSFAFIPFGAGSRSCIGSQFAMMEMVMIMAVIGQRFEMKRAIKERKVEPEPLVSLRVKGGLELKIQKRGE